jgi:hypothetical protein
MLGDSRERTVANRASTWLAFALLVIVAPSPAWAQGPTFSIDFQGPTIGIPDFCGGFPITEGDILSVGLPGPNPPAAGPLPPPCVEIGSIPGSPGVIPGGLGVGPGIGGFTEVDALSYAKDRGSQLVFSVDEFASGVPGPLPPDVATQGSTGNVMEASADVFAYRGPLVPTAPGPVVGNTIALDGDGLSPPGALGLGLIEPNPPTPAVTPDPGDNLDALDVNTEAADLLGAIWFSLDSAFIDPNEGAPVNSGTAAGNGFSSADVLVSVAGGFPAVGIPAAALGLDLLGFDTDDLDALVFLDADLSGGFSPPDTIYFSVRFGSAVIGTPDSAFGAPIEPGDILTVPAGAGLPPAIFIPAEALGLGTLRSGTAGPFGPDDVDAIDLRGNATFSIDVQGPTAGAPDSFFAVPITEGDILTPALPGLPGPNPAAFGPLLPPGIEVGALPGAAGAVGGGLGIVPGFSGFVELDALSYGRDRGTRVLFSVDEFASGGPSPSPPDVTSEGAAGAMEASADVFEYLGQVIPTTPAVVKGNTVALDGDGIFPSGAPGFGLVEPNPATPALFPDPGDNVDAFDADTVFADLLGPIYFSLDASFPDPLELPPVNGGTAAGNGFSGADVLVSFAGGAPVGAIPAPTLGLDLAGFDTDDLDALIFDDADGSGTYTPGDMLLFSVRRGSAVIGFPDGLLGLPIEEGDILSPPPLGPGFPPGIFIPAESLGLGTLRAGTAGPFGSDDLDALDSIPLPEPGIGLQLGVGLAFLLLAGRRRARP